MAAEIIAGLGALKTAFDIAKGLKDIDNAVSRNAAVWPAPGSEDTELGVLIGPEVRHGEAEVHARVQA